MVFIHPMWDNESERIGKRLCTPSGYTLHVIAELVGFGGLLLLLATPFALAWRVVARTFQAAEPWSLAVPFAVGVVSEVLFQYSWRLAFKRGYRYDTERCEASWLEAGERCTYKYPANPGDALDRGRGAGPGSCASRSAVERGEPMAESAGREFVEPADDVICWLEQDSSVMLKAVTKFGDPVELTADEARSIAAALMTFAERLEPLPAKDAAPG